MNCCLILLIISHSRSCLLWMRLKMTKLSTEMLTLQFVFSAVKRKESEISTPQENRGPKKPRLVFTDIQRRTLHAIFKETKRPSKEMQATIAQQLGLEVTTVANFFMNARRRSVDKWRDDNGNDNRESAPTGMPKSWNCVKQWIYFMYTCTGVVS